MPETIESINSWARETFPGATHVGRLDKFFDECAEFGLIDDPNIEELDFDELPDVFITLVQVMADHFGSAEAAQAAVDEKMAINRARTWNIREDGTGQHREETNDGESRVSDATDNGAGAS